MSYQIQQACEEARLWNEINSDRQGTVMEHGLNGEKKRWEPPLPGYVKCNIHSNWRNARIHSGIALIIRDPQSKVLHHARDAITFYPNRFTAELRCLAWALRSRKDLGYTDVVIGSDFREIIEAVRRSNEWPRFHIFLQEIEVLCSLFCSVAFETESFDSNQIAREIARSVLRDGRFNSYLALGDLLGCIRES
ncbi:uncharacterized protein LOC108869659 [Brassica rapa]|uniref:uncharacterized protein LOC108869659 n=1 Tax=Brassica campestris TaxID=3711 RepID=UPI000871DC5B|nr:uncharacterized protein LOC108869659 [Brassica rapa]